MAPIVYESAGRHCDMPESGAGRCRGGLVCLCLYSHSSGLLCRKTHNLGGCRHGYRLFDARLSKSFCNVEALSAAPGKEIISQRFESVHFCVACRLVVGGFEALIAKGEYVSFARIGGMLFLAGGLSFLGEAAIETFVGNTSLGNTLYACVTGISAFLLGRSAGLTRLNVRGGPRSLAAA